MKTGQGVTPWDQASTLPGIAGWDEWGWAAWPRGIQDPIPQNSEIIH